MSSLACSLCMYDAEHIGLHLQGDRSLVWQLQHL